MTALIGDKRVLREHSAGIPSDHGCAPNCGGGHTSDVLWIGGVLLKGRSPNDAETRSDRSARPLAPGCTIHCSGTLSTPPAVPVEAMLTCLDAPRLTQTTGGDFRRTSLGRAPNRQAAASHYRIPALMRVCLFLDILMHGSVLRLFRGFASLRRTVPPTAQPCSLRT